MIDYHVMGLLPVPAEYPSWQPVAQNSTHWAGVVRCDGPCPVDAEILAAIETSGGNTYQAMIDGLNADTMARFRAVHPAEIETVDEDGVAAMVPTGPIVTFA